jgi:hypothetical protein
MRARRIIVVALVPGIVLLLLLAIVSPPAPNGQFRKYVSPRTPSSLKVVAFKSDDWFGVKPEPVCFLTFSASQQDLAKVILEGVFRAVGANDAVPVLHDGPAGWMAIDQIGPNGRAYMRSHTPGMVARWLPIGRNRRWVEYLWVDSTGTNACFLLWGV